MIIALLVGIVVFCLTAFILIARTKKGSEPESVPQMDRRREPRVPVTSDFDLHWQDRDASRKSTRAKGIEISEHGVSVRSAKPIERNSVIQIRGCQIQMEGKATVKYCSKRGLSYVIGLEVEKQSAQQLKAAGLRG